MCFYFGQSSLFRAAGVVSSCKVDIFGTARVKSKKFPALFKITGKNGNFHAKPVFYEI